MKIRLRRLNDAVHMEAENEQGNTISIDGSEKVGGENAGFRPMQLLLAGIGGCSAIDIIDILKKQKQKITDIHIEVDADREQGNGPNLFKGIHVLFKLEGQLDENKVKRAVDLSMQKYCSVARILEKTADITYEYTINSAT